MNIKSNENNSNNITSNKLIVLANFISILPFFLVISIGIYYPFQIINLVNPIFSLKFIIGYFASITTAEYLKHKLYHLSPIMKRPEGACGCDYLSAQGDVSDKPGFPSGHMSSVAFFTVYTSFFIFKSKFTAPIKNTLLVLNFGFLLSTGWARWIKKCHSLYQIFAGTLLGSIISFVFIKI